MLLFETYVAPSEIEGVGVFTAQDIPAGTAIWRLDPTIDRLIPVAEVPGLPEVTQAFIERYAYPLPGNPSFLVLEVDNGRFMNHAARPNTDFKDPAVGFALVDIPADTEITSDYSEFDPGFEMLPGRLFKVHTNGDGRTHAVAVGAP